MLRTRRGWLAVLVVLAGACGSRGDLLIPVRNDDVGMAGSAGRVGGPGAGTQPACGNGVLEVGEMCDGAQLGGESCASVTMGTTPLGDLACSSACTFDTSDCDRESGGGAGFGGSGAGPGVGGMGAGVGAGGMGPGVP